MEENEENEENFSIFPAQNIQILITFDVCQPPSQWAKPFLNAFICSRFH